MLPKIEGACELVTNFSIWQLHYMYFTTFRLKWHCCWIPVHLWSNLKQKSVTLFRRARSKLQGLILKQFSFPYYQCQIAPFNHHHSHLDQDFDGMLSFWSCPSKYLWFEISVFVISIAIICAKYECLCCLHIMYIFLFNTYLKICTKYIFF